MELLLSFLALIAVIVFALAFGMDARQSMAQVTSMTQHMNELRQTMSEHTVRVDELKELVQRAEEKAESAEHSGNDMKSDLMRLKGKVASLSEDLESWRERSG